MITTQDLWQKELPEGFTLMAGREGLNKPVENVGILEYEADEEIDENFFRGDFVITSLFYAKDDPEFATACLKRLIDNHVSCIAVKLVHVDGISEEVLKYATKHKVSIFYFDHIHFEDLVFTIFDALRKKKDLHFYEKKVNALMKPTHLHRNVKKIALEINSSLFDNIICAYCVEKDYKNDKNNRYIVEGLGLRRNKMHRNVSYSVFQYSQGIIVIYSFKEDHPKLESNLKHFIDSISIRKDRYYIGISDKHHNLNELDLCIKKSIYALNNAQRKHLQSTEFKSLGIEKIILPLKDNYWFKSYCLEIIDPILEYDEENNGQLMLTAEYFVKNNGNISNTAKEMHQHKNTIRYRIDKLKKIIPSGDDNFYEHLFIAIKYYKTHKTSYRFPKVDS